MDEFRRIRMTNQFESNEKFFTTVVSKEAIDVIIQTTTHRIKGNIYIRPGERLKDGLNQDDPFFAITDAEIYDPSGTVLYTSDFVAVNQEHIVWLLPVGR
jgi:hypothetical protein